MNTALKEDTIIHNNKSIKNEKLLNRQFIAVSFIAFIYFFADYILTTTIPLYALKIGGTASTAGAFISIIAITALILRPMMGHLMDTKTRKLVLITGTIALAAAALFYEMAGSISLILFFAVIHGLSTSAITTSAPTIVADVTPSSRLAEGLSLYGIAMNATLAAGPIAALYLLDKFGCTLTFNAALSLALLGVALTFLINYEKKAPKLPGKVIKTKAKLNIRTMFEKTALKPSLYQIFLAFGMSTVMAFIPIYGKSRGIDNIGAFFTLYAVSGVIVSFLTGKLVQKYGTGKIFIPGLLMQLIAFLFLAFAHSLPLMLAAAVLYGFGSGASLTVVSIIGMESAPPERRGAANATMFAAMDIGVALGSMILGVVSAKFGFTMTFVITAVVIGVDIIVFSILHKESRFPQG